MTLETAPETDRTIDLLRRAARSLRSTEEPGFAEPFGRFSEARAPREGRDHLLAAAWP